MEWTPQATKRLRDLWAAYYKVIVIAGIFKTEPFEVYSKSRELKLPRREPWQYANCFVKKPHLEVWPPPVVRAVEKPPAPKYPVSTFVVPKYLRPMGNRCRLRTRAVIVLGYIDDQPVPANAHDAEPQPCPRPDPDDGAGDGVQKRRRNRSPKTETKPAVPVVSTPRRRAVPVSRPEKLTRTTRVWSDEENQADIEEWLRRHKVTKCPPAFVAPTQNKVTGAEEKQRIQKIEQVRKKTAEEIIEARRRTFGAHRNWYQFRERVFHERKGQ